MSGHRRAAALVAALLVALILPVVAPPGVARGGEPEAAAFPPPVPITSTISGFALGSDGGTLAGGTITACAVSTFNCSSATLAGDDSYAVTVLTGFAYRVAIDPPFPYLSGYYDDLAVSAFTQDFGSATAVPVFTGDVFLRTMLVPRSFVPPPSPGAIAGYVFGANDGPLTGATVTACNAVWSCASATVGYDGSYWIGYLPAGSYTLAITPLLGSGYASGYYAAWAQGFFTTSAADATVFSVWNTVTLPAIVVQWGYPVPAYGAISGTVVGASGGSLVGGTVTACNTSYSCASSAIGSSGAYHIGFLPAGVYVVSITPPSTAYLSGYYRAGASGNFTTSASLATGVTVWNSDVLLPTIVVPWAPTYGSISGKAIGLSAGALAGGTVSACNAAASCVSASIGTDGSYWVGTLPSGSYTVKITPISTSGYPTGYYASGASGYFTTSASSATVVNVAGAGVALPTITVPWTGTGTGGIVVDHPKAYVVWAYLRPEFTEGTTTSLRIAQGERAELASYIDPALSGMRVEVWRRLKGKAWVMITTRGISGAGWVIYRFTATGGTNGAQYRFHLPATSLTISVWSVARTVRLL